MAEREKIGVGVLWAERERVVGRRGEGNRDRGGVKVEEQYCKLAKQIRQYARIN